MPSISLLPSFSDLLSPEEKNKNQSIVINTTGIENTQSVSVALTSNPKISYTQRMNNNTATVIVPSSDLQQLTDGKSYKIVASVANIFGDTRQAIFDFSIESPVFVGGGSSMFIQHQDVSLGIVTTMNFSGTGLTVVFANEIAEINVDGDFDGGGFTE